MPLPDLTHLQFLILSALLGQEKSGRDLRATLSEEEGGKKRTLPAFYQLMARMVEADFVEDRYELKDVDGHEVNEKIYKITKGGVTAFNEYRKFATRLGNVTLQEERSV